MRKKEKKKINFLGIILIFVLSLFLISFCYFSLTGFSVFGFLKDLFTKQGEISVSNNLQPAPNSLIDTISLNPTGVAPGTGLDFFGANTDSGYDYAFGSAFKVANEQKLKAVEFLVRQNVPGAGANALIYEGQGISGGGDLYYWTPRYSSNPIATLKLAQPYPDSSNTNDFQIFRFESDEPLTLKANTPYVIVFDPIPTAEGQGTYTLPNIASSVGFLSSIGQPEQDIFMPSFLIRRLMSTKTSFTYNQWTFTRIDRRYLVRLISPSQTPSNAGEISFSSGVCNVYENQGPMRLEVKRLSGSDGTATATYTTIDRSAKRGQDYAGASGTLSWSDKDSSIKYIEIPIINNAIYEGNKDFKVVLTSASGASLGTVTESIVNIIEDESPQPPQPQTYSLTITKTGAGSGTVTSFPLGINCGSDCSESYASGTSVTLTANPDASSQFAGWGGDCSASGTSPTCTISMTSAKSVTARFEPKTIVLYNCQGEPPAPSERIITGASKYTSGYTPTKWTFIYRKMDGSLEREVSSTTPCLWACKEGFLPTRDGLGKIIGCRSMKERTLSISDIEIKKENEFFVFKELDVNKTLLLINTSKTESEILEKAKESVIIRNNDTEIQAYLIISNFSLENSTKEIHLERVLPNSNAVCIADRENLSSKENITQDCLTITCPGRLNDYECIVNNTEFIVKGLKHSGVIEYYIAPATTPTQTSTGGGASTVVYASKCVSNWSCSWTECLNGQKKYLCNDLNNCKNPTNKPEESTESCEEESINCTDNDGDGYGIGDGCIGIDLDDTNASITNQITQAGESASEENKNAKNKKTILLVLISIFVLILIFAILILFYFRTKSKKDTI